ncbi:general transcription factor II-I repeat domain-containing protein 2-like [Octopus bimaculoides]|uniref:general transcription factor II-I repeat domain-containing protein 2-like n=1 Tax=Octopus bimaculoides TaxID=37653 RepID=UPI00071E5B23|nr:general transcription factor II-I repeat domain-containing protein 2-like [Octopus bimaculoides]|eukprot:XP_014774134.1 PREDICTED: general transcription factor II-I repeat domain-containing protein 2-like [Octopus bimaculoides]
MEIVVRTVNFIQTRSLNYRQIDNLLSDIGVTYGLPYHTEVRWLSRGAMLKCFVNLQKEIERFMEEKGKLVLEFQSPEWLQDLAFIVNITEQLNNLNKMLQGRKNVVTQNFESISAFKLRLTLWETQLSGGDPAYFRCLKDVVATADNVDMNRYKDNIMGLLREFQQRFQIFDELETNFTVFRSSFIINASFLPPSNP